MNYLSGALLTTAYAINFIPCSSKEKHHKIFGSAAYSSLTTAYTNDWFKSKHNNRKII